MESPPSCSAWSEVFICSEDSGLLLTSGSSCSVSLENQPGHLPFEFQNSDFDDKSLSQADSLDDMSDVMCGDNFNTLKKGLCVNELTGSKLALAIEPPPEFQDKPVWLNRYTNHLALLIIRDALHAYRLLIAGKSKCTKLVHNTSTTLVSSAWFSPARPSSRSSLGSGGAGRLSCSHSSLATPSSARHPDDSSFITQAVSICELYSVPLDGGDVYAVPVDVVRNAEGTMERQRQRPRAPLPRRPARRSVAGLPPTPATSQRHGREEPIHMTLQEVRQYLQTLYSSSSDSSEHRISTQTSKQRRRSNTHNADKMSNNNRYKENVTLQNGKVICTEETTQIKNKKNSKNKKNEVKRQHISSSTDPIGNSEGGNKKCPVRSLSSSLKQTLCNLFRWRRSTGTSGDEGGLRGDRTAPLAARALPPLPSEGRREASPQPMTSMDFATSIQKVKDYGWYWGPISSEAAERILLNEPDGSFIVRDSSDDHYIFSLTFRLQSGVRHVRIEHDQGNFSFGSCTRFKSHTIVEFIERAVEHSRSGRYLFFLHRRPLLGPMRVQLLHPVSRFKRVQSLQHMCRFVILKQVRKDKISQLPLPRRIVDYLNTPHYYAEQLETEQLEKKEPAPVEVEPQ